MNAKLNTKDTVTQYNFSVDYEGKTYGATIYVNDSSDFIDWQITIDGQELDHEGSDGVVREAIIDYFDKNWDSLV